MMENCSAKRRKLDHPGTIIASIDPGLHRYNALILETDQLLKAVQQNYKERFAGSGHVLQRLKEAFEAIEPHEDLPVGQMPPR